MNEITFQDKEALNTNPSIPEINKITDDNINEIKSVVNAGVVVDSGSNGYGNYVKFGDGTMICRGVTPPITTPAGNGETTLINLPASFKDSNYIVTTQIFDGQLEWESIIGTNVYDRATNLFYLATWNIGQSANSNQQYQYIAIGNWK